MLDQQRAMNDIQFNCPNCGELLAVAATDAGGAVACPQCGQAISVPQLTPPSSAKTRTWAGGRWPAILGVLVLSLLVAGLLLWRKHGATPVTVVSGNPATVTRGLVLYYNFDAKPAAGKIPDLSGHGNDGEAMNVHWVADGHRGGAIVFSATDSFIRVSNNESLNPPHFTLYAWIKTSRSGHYWRRIFDKGLFHDNFCLSIAGDWTRWKPPTKYRGFLEFEMPKTPETTSRYPLADGQWHQIAATYDGQDKRLFVDGLLQDEAHRPGVSLGNDLDLVIGGFTDPDPKNDDPHASFEGSLDDVMIFDRALSPEEVADLYNSQKTASDAAQ
jgi:hypothetical protein